MNYSPGPPVLPDPGGWENPPERALLLPSYNRERQVFPPSLVNMDKSEVVSLHPTLSCSEEGFDLTI